MTTRIAGTFADFKLIKGRKVAQIVVEIPIEQADAIVAALGGLPNPAVERWVAMAPVNMEAARAASNEMAGTLLAQGEADRLRVSEGSRPASASPASEKRQRTLAEKAAWYCKSPSFQTWLHENHGCYDDALKQCDASYGPGNWSFEHAAKHTIYIHCGVTSRGDITPGSVAGRLFLDLEAQFHDWQRRAA